MTLTNDKEESFESQKIDGVDGSGIGRIVEGVAHLPRGKGKGRQPQQTYASIQ